MPLQNPPAERAAAPSSAAALPTDKLAWLQPRDLDHALEIAGHLSRSGLVPKDYVGKPGNVLVAMIHGEAIGLPVLGAMQSIAVIHGRPSVWGKALPAIVRARGGQVIDEKIGERGTDSYGYRVTLKRTGHPDTVREFTVEDAKRARLWEAADIEPSKRKYSPWVRWPDRMLLSKARGFAVNDGASDWVLGLEVAEDVIDEPVPVEVVVLSSEPGPGPGPAEDTGGEAVEVEMPREPKTFSQQSPPRRAKVGDLWVHSKTGERKILAEVDGHAQTWQDEPRDPDFEIVEDDASASQDAPTADADGQSTDAPAEQEDAATAADEADTPLDQARRGLGDRARQLMPLEKPGAIRHEVATIATQVVGRAVFVSTDLRTVEEVAAVLEELELRHAKPPEAQS